MFYVHSFYYDCAHLLACITLTGMVASYQGQPSISRGFIHHDLTFFAHAQLNVYASFYWMEHNQSMTYIIYSWILYLVLARF